MSIIVSILIVSYNTRDLTVNCIQSVLDQALEKQFEIIVVDNDSSDGSADEIANRFPDLKLIRSQDNLGFGRANNLASVNASGEYILLLNPDTIVLAHAVDKLIEFARSTREARLWGGRTVFPDGSLNPTSCWRFMSPWSLFLQALGLSKLFPDSDFLNREAYAGWHRDNVREVDMVTGCFLLIESRLWRDLGGFDESFFMYGEEMDLCFRARRMGARPHFTPDASIVHYDGASEPVQSAKMIRLLSGKSHYLKKNWRALPSRCGLILLKLHVLIRTIGSRISASLHGGEKQKMVSDGWKSVWLARNQWCKGFRQ